MPAPPLSNNFEGGVDDNNIQTSDTGSGDAWNSVLLDGAGGTLTYDNTHSYDTLAAQVTTGTGSANADALRWSGFGSLAVNVWVRIYVYLTANPTVNSLRVWIFRDNAAAAGYRLDITTIGQVILSDGATTATSSASVTLNQWVRLEAQAKCTTTTSFIARLYNSPDSETITETVTHGGPVTKTNIDMLDTGASASRPASYTYWFDEVAVSTVGWIGPRVEVPVITPQASDDPPIGILGKGAGW